MINADPPVDCGADLSNKACCLHFHTVQD